MAAQSGRDPLNASGEMCLDGRLRVGDRVVARYFEIFNFSKTGRAKRGAPALNLRAAAKKPPITREFMKTGRVIKIANYARYAPPLDYALDFSTIFREDGLLLVPRTTTTTYSRGSIGLIGLAWLIFARSRVIIYSSPPPFFYFILFDVEMIEAGDRY